MGRILKVILVHIAITMLIAFVLPSSQSPPRPACLTGPSSTVWDYQHNLIHPTYPPQDLDGRYLSAHSDQLTLAAAPVSQFRQLAARENAHGKKGATK
jgi:hypothetical protein